MHWTMTGPMWAFLTSWIAVVGAALGYESYDDLRYRRRLAELLEASQ